MSFDKFENLIENNSLFFCRADQFEDKWEGRFPANVIKKFDLDEKPVLSDDGNTYTRLKWHIKKELRSHLINCWHVDDTESFAMWKLYGKNHQLSVAIQSTIGRLKQSLKANSEIIWIGEVEYIDFRKWEAKNRFFNTNVSNTLQMFFLKWHYFKYENEIRAIINKAYSKHKEEKGLLVKIDLPELIDRIYVAPTADNENEKKIKDTLKAKGYTFRIERSDLGLKHYV